MDKGGTGYSDMVGSDFPGDITVLESHSELQTLDFKRATTDEGIYNHHNVFMELVNPGVVYGCDGIQGATQLPMSVFAAGATEDGVQKYYSEDGTVKSGYYLPKNPRLINTIDVINYNNEVRTVYTVTEIEYLDGKPAGYLDTRQQRVDPGICGGPNGAAIHPPKGQSRFSVKTQNIVAKKDGYILNARGHMHDGGINIILKVNDKEVCNSRAVYGGPGHVTKIDGKVWETISESTYCNHTVPVKKGDSIYMQANYDVELHPSREQGGHGGMMMGGMRKRSWLDSGSEAEQMAMMITEFAS